MQCFFVSQPIKRKRHETTHSQDSNQISFQKFRCLRKFNPDFRQIVSSARMAPWHRNVDITFWNEGIKLLGTVFSIKV